MKKIIANQALEMIQSFGNTYAMEADSLRYLMKEGEPVTCYANDCVLFVYSHHDTDYATVVPLYESFDCNELLDVLHTTAPNTSMLIDVQCLSSDCITALDQALADRFNHERTLKDYIHTADMICNIEAFANIKLLTADDRAIFISCTDEILPNRPPLALLFDLFVCKGQGHILAAYTGEKMVGYLSFTRLTDSLYDVDCIYVVPEYRKQGYGKQLGAAYVAFAHEQGADAYWSNAKTAESEEIARSCGFEPNREARKYVKK